MKVDHLIYNSRHHQCFSITGKETEGYTSGYCFALPKQGLFIAGEKGDKDKK